MVTKAVLKSAPYFWDWAQFSLSWMAKNAKEKTRRKRMAAHLSSFPLARWSTREPTEMRSLLGTITACFSVPVFLYVFLVCARDNTVIRFRGEICFPPHSHRVSGSYWAITPASTKRRNSERELNCFSDKSHLVCSSSFQGIHKGVHCPGGGGGTPYNGLYGEVRPKCVAFSCWRYIKG